LLNLIGKLYAAAVMRFAYLCNLGLNEELMQQGKSESRRREGNRSK